MYGVRPVACLCSQGCARRRGRQARAERRMRGPSSSPAGEAQVGPGAHSCGVLPIAGLRRLRLDKRRRRPLARAERRRGGCRSSSRAKPGSGWEPVVGIPPHRQLARSRRSRGRRRRQVRERRRGGGGASPTLPDEARIRPGAHSFGVGPSPGCVIEVAQAARASPDKG